MSRSTKLAVIRDKPRNKKATSLYWRRIRSKINQLVRMGVEDLPDEKTIINDFDYSDYKFTPEFDSKERYLRHKLTEEDYKEDLNKHRRK